MSAARTATAPGGPQTPLQRYALQLDAFGELKPISRLGGQGRVHRPASTPPELGSRRLVVKLYRRTPSAAAARVLAAMIAWGWSLEPEEALELHRLTTWPMAIVSSGLMPVGIAMRDVGDRFAVPFVMPSGRRERVLLALEHLLGGDSYLQQRGLGVALDTSMRALVAERISGALSYLHRRAIVVSDLAPSNLLVAFDRGQPSVCFIDCDSMVFCGEQGLAPVETGDWDIPASFDEPPRTRSADGYKLGLLMLRLFARSHDARAIEPHLQYVPAELRELLTRSLAPDAANRPPAGEWQRALRELIARGELNQRYPGPVKRPHPRPAAQAVHPPVREAPRPPVAQVPLSGSWAAGRPAAGRGAQGSTWLRPAVVMLWVIAGTVLFILVLSRLFADTVPTQSFQPQYARPSLYQYGAPRGGALNGPVGVPGTFQNP